MKCVFVTILLLGSLTIVFGFDSMNFREGIMKCIREDSFKNSRSEDYKERSKILWLCTLTHYGVIKNNEFDKEAYVKAVEEANKGDIDEEDCVAEAQKAGDACEEKIGSDHATALETAHVLIECLQDASNPNVERKLAEELTEKCKIQEHVNVTEYRDKWKPKGKLPNVDSAKRLARCKYTAKGTMTDGKFDKEGYINWVNRLQKGEEYKDQVLAIAHKMADVCEEKVGDGGSTPEDTAKMIHDCFSIENRKLRIYDGF